VAKKSGKAVLDIPVEFGGVSIGRTTARLGIGFNRSACSLEEADNAFCGHRLNGRVVLDGKGDSPGQKKFVEVHEVAGVFDVKRIGVNATSITTGLTFSLGDVDIQELAKLSKGSGRLLINAIAELPDDAPDEDDEDHKLLPGSLKYDGDRMEAPLSHIFEGAILKAFSKAKLKTVADLAAITKDGAPLTTITGIGEGKAEQIIARMDEYYRDNPEE
jgi:hypothetical protein